MLPGLPSLSPAGCELHSGSSSLPARASAAALGRLGKLTPPTSLLCRGLCTPRVLLGSGPVSPDLALTAPCRSQKLAAQKTRRGLPAIPGSPQFS